jgi:hypothetical protein
MRLGRQALSIWASFAMPIYRVDYAPRIRLVEIAPLQVLPLDFTLQHARNDSAA